MINETPRLARRLVCMLYEGLVVFSILLIGFLLPQIVFHAFGLNGGQTLPMKTWKMRIVNADGSKLRPLQAVLRYLAAWPSILFFGIGILWALFDKDKQFLHDRLAGSRIISSQPPT